MASGGCLVVLGVVLSGDGFWTHANDWMGENIEFRKRVLKSLKHVVDWVDVVDFVEYDGINLYDCFTSCYDSVANCFTHICNYFAICDPNIVV